MKKDIRKVLPQDTHGTRLEHQGKREFHGIAKPTLGKSTEQMTMCDENNVTRVLAVHVVFVDSTNLFDQVINTVRDLLCRPRWIGSDVSRIELQE